MDRIKIDKIKRKIEEIESISKSELGIDISTDLRGVIEKLEGRQKTIDPWKRVELARHTDRPTTLDYVRLIFDDYMELHGDRYFGDDPAMVGGVGIFGGVPVTFIGHQKGKNVKENVKRNFGMAHPEGYRKALRLALQAEKFNRPIISFLDTPGAFCGIPAEERGIGRAIAEKLKVFAGLKIPIVVVIIGEGGSGGALGIGVGDFFIMLENAVYSVISPEGFASILLRDAGKAKEAASLMKLTAEDLKNFGVIDRIVEEPGGGAHVEMERTASLLKREIQNALDMLKKRSIRTLLKERRKKLFSIGVYKE